MIMCISNAPQTTVFKLIPVDEDSRIYVKIAFISHQFL